MTIHLQQLGVKWTGVPMSEENNLAHDKSELEGQETQLIVGEWKLNDILKILIDEADFMFDDKMREELQKATL